MDLCRIVFTLVFLVHFIRGSEGGSGRSSTERNDQPLHLLVLAPFPPRGVHYSESEYYAAGPYLVPAVNLAVEHINANESILPGYTLTYVVKNSGCTDGSAALVSYASYVFHSGIPVAGIVGPACSDAAEAIAPLLAHNASRQLMITLGTSPELAISPMKDTTFRIVESALVYIEVFLGLMERNKWNKVGALYESDRLYFYTTFSKFADEVHKDKLIFTSGISNTHLPIRLVVADRVRVVFVFAGSMLSRKLVCLAFHDDVMYPKLQLIFHDKRKAHFKAIEFKYDGQIYKCTQEDMDVAMQGAIFANYDLARETTDVTPLVSGVTYSEYRQQYNSSLPDDVFPEDDYVNSYYDAMWAMALALHGSIPWFDQNNISVASYHYGMYYATEEVRHQLSKVEFEGVSGHMNFSETQEPRSNIVLFQVQCSSVTSKECMELSIGHYRTGFTMSIQGDIIVKDHFSNVTIREISVVWGSVAFTITALMILSVVILHVVYIRWRNLPSIKAMSLNLTHLIFAGCYLFAIRSIVLIVRSVFPFSILSHPLIHSILCSVPWWTLAFGTSLIFGTLGARMWRIYRIFSTFQQSHRLLSDFSLTCFVIILLLMDTCYFVVVNVVSPCILTEQDGHFNGQDTYIVHVRCLCDYDLAVWLVHIYKWILLMMCTILSFLTRKVRIRKYKNSREVAFIVYCMLISQSFVIVLSVVFSRYAFVNFLANFLMSSLLILFCIVFIFLPPLLPLVHVVILKLRFFYHAPV